MVKRYQHSEHLEQLTGWLKHYDLPVPPLPYFSDHGYCVDDIVIGFLFKSANSKTCYIDHIAANPNVSKSDRDKAVKTLLSLLEADAAREGFQLITILASLPTMKARLEQQGFQIYSDFSLYFKPLS